MAMNEYGEIVRPDNQSSSTSGNISSENSRSYDSFSSDVVNHFTAARKRNFNIITLLITIPFYAVIGYFTAEYFQYKYAYEYCNYDNKTKYGCNYLNNKLYNFNDN